MSGVKVLVGSKCCFRALGQNFGRVKVSEGQTVGRVKLSLGSKCRQGQSVFGVNVGVSPKSASTKGTSTKSAQSSAQRWFRSIHNDSDPTLKNTNCAKNRRVEIEVLHYVWQNEPGTHDRFFNYQINLKKRMQGVPRKAMTAVIMPLNDKKASNKLMKHSSVMKSFGE